MYYKICFTVLISIIIMLIFQVFVNEEKKILIAFVGDSIIIAVYVAPFIILGAILSYLIGKKIESQFGITIINILIGIIISLLVNWTFSFNSDKKLANLFMIIAVTGAISFTLCEYFPYKIKHLIGVSTPKVAR
jgi:hypothetical protein